MLRAKSDEGKLVTLATLRRSEIEFLRKHHQFFCPVCHNKVIIKAGQKIVPHFAHKVKSQCPSFKRGEGVYHLKGKLLLYKWLKKQHITVRLEPYLKKINQIPDLLIKINGRYVALEFQCARTSITTIQQRNIGYKRLGIIPIWILGKNLFKRRYRQLHLDSFTSQFIHKFNRLTPTTIYYFCPEQKLVYIITNIFMTSSTRAIHSLRVSNLSHINFKQLFMSKKKSEKAIFKQWLKQVKRFRLTQRHYAYGSELKWRKWLYSKQLAIDRLPFYIYLPTELQFIMNVPPWNWQSRLCLDIINPLQVGDSFTLSQCYNMINRYMNNPQRFPLINEYISPVEQYLTYLQKLQLIKRTSKNSYIKQRKITIYRHIEEAIKSDNVLIKRLMYNCS